MALFDYNSEDARQLHIDLIISTDGTEPCFDENILDSTVLTDSPTDGYVEGWSSKKAVSKEEAEAMCAGCKVLLKCENYARVAEEPYGIWGGTRPVDRGIPPKYKA